MAERVVEVRGPGAAVVTGADALDLDDLRPVVGEQHGAERPGHGDADLDDPDAVEWSGAHAHPSARWAARLILACSMHADTKMSYHGAAQAVSRIGFAACTRRSDGSSSFSWSGAGRGRTTLVAKPPKRSRILSPISS